MMITHMHGNKHWSKVCMHLYACRSPAWPVSVAIRSWTNSGKNLSLKNTVRCCSAACFCWYKVLSSWPRDGYTLVISYQSKTHMCKCIHIAACELTAASWACTLAFERWLLRLLTPWLEKQKAVMTKHMKSFGLVPERLRRASLSLTPRSSRQTMGFVPTLATIRSANRQPAQRRRLENYLGSRRHRLVGL